MGFIHYVILAVAVLVAAAIVKMAMSEKARKDPVKYGALGFLMIIVTCSLIWFSLDWLAGSNPPGKDLTKEASVSSIEQASRDHIDRRFVPIEEKGSKARQKNIQENISAKERFKALPPVSRDK